LNENLFEARVPQLRPVPHRAGIVQVNYQIHSDSPPASPDQPRSAKSQPITPLPPSAAPLCPQPSRQSDRKRTPNKAPKTH
jgi:hypothetical protein